MLNYLTVVKNNIMTVKFYDEEISDSIELVPDYENNGIKIMAANENDLSLVVVNLSKDDVDDLRSALYDIMNKVERFNKEVQ